MSNASLTRSLWIGALLRAVSVSLLLACASPGALDAPHVSSEERDEALEETGSAMLLDLLHHRKRMINIEYRLAKINASKCGPMSRPHAGVLVTTDHSFDQRKIQAVASEILSLSKGLTIVHVVPGGSFDKGGLREGDQILALDDEPVNSAADITTLMLSSGDRKSARVKVRRKDAPEFEAWVPLEHTCPIRLGLTTSTLIIPSQSQRLLISIPLGLVRYVSDDSTLAVAVSHQIAHTLFDKPDDDALTSEMRADRNGLRMAAAAGYDIGVAVAYWEDVAIEYPALIGPAPSTWRPLAWQQNVRLLESQLPHPEIARRMDSIRATVRAEQARISAPVPTR